jgi:uncharacterized membrane protein YgcG
MSSEDQQNVITPTPRPVPARPPQAHPDRNPARVVSAIALASVAAGAINIAAAATVGRNSAQNLAFFLVVGVAQLAWAAVALARASRWWLALGAVGNLFVVATWVVSRSVGLPVGEYAGIRLPIQFPDVLATVLEITVVVGAAALMIRGRGPARPATRSPGVAVAAALVAGGLALGGVLVQAGEIGSSPSGSSQTGPSVNAHANYSGGGGTSGGGTSSGGSYPY